MDSEGYIYFKSRIKDVIIRGGANIYPGKNYKREPIIVLLIESKLFDNLI
jgi:hypothetical protein